MRSARKTVLMLKTGRRKFAAMLRNYRRLTKLYLCFIVVYTSVMTLV